MAALVTDGDAQRENERDERDAQGTREEAHKECGRCQMNFDPAKFRLRQDFDVLDGSEHVLTKIDAEERRRDELGKPIDIGSDV
jgi:hypothetical protein